MNRRARTTALASRRALPPTSPFAPGPRVRLALVNGAARLLVCSCDCMSCALGQHCCSCRNGGAR
jgi:hypothetical protein